MATRWTRFYRKQLENKQLRAMVERELEALRLGVQIARLRAEQRLTQAKLAARADISGSKISAIETRPKNVTIATLIRISQALNRRLEIRFLPQKRRKRRRTFG